ncbi:MAG: hypothetical protein HC777_01950 [Hyphomonadaceae bacterium]|nr:hypothetical protein [Hyphomonadaceae bacterium]
MNKFLTLMRRDIADNRGALIITPLVVATILLVITLGAAMTGGARFGLDPKDFRAGMAENFKAEIEAEGGRAVISQEGPNGRVTVTDQDGNTRSFGGMPSAEDLKVVAPVLASATGASSLLPLGISMIAILFALAGALHDERKDRTILFWKSMPVSDLQTVGAKLLTIVGFGLVFAFAVSLVLNVAITTIAAITINQFTGLSIVTMMSAVFTASAQLWFVLFLALLLYILGALPVYGWASMVSAWAPKAPFLAAFAPLIVLPLAYLLVVSRGQSNDPIMNVLWDPGARLLGGRVTQSVSAAFEETPIKIPVGRLLSEFGQQVREPDLWLGLLFAAGFIFAASEIRRRRAL